MTIKHLRGGVSGKKQSKYGDYTKVVNSPFLGDYTVVFTRKKTKICYLVCHKQYSTFNLKKISKISKWMRTKMFPIKTSSNAFINGNFDCPNYCTDDKKNQTNVNTHFLSFPKRKFFLVFFVFKSLVLTQVRKDMKDVRKLEKMLFKFGMNLD